MVGGNHTKLITLHDLILVDLMNKKESIAISEVTFEHGPVEPVETQGSERFGVQLFVGTPGIC